MKNFISSILLVIIIPMGTYGQVHYSGTSFSGTDPSAIGTYTKANGNATFAAGYGSEAGNNNATAIGMYSFATGNSSMSFGTRVKSSGQYSIVIGKGGPWNESIFLENTMPRSLMIGFQSTRPTLFISESPLTTGLYNQTGKVAIGNVVNEDGYMDPQAKLHIRADNNIDDVASIFIEPYDWGAGEEAGLAIGNMYHGITAKNNIGLQFHTQLYYTFNEGNIGINTTKPMYNLHVVGSLFTNQFTLFDEHSLPREGYILVSDDTGQGFWRDPNEYGSWKINPNNGVDLYFPEGVEGNVGIGTINTYGYRLAVNGSILTDEVMVKDPIDWFDYVLKPEYKLMPLYELEAFINSNYHLPDVPSEADVKKDGFGLAEMNGILLKKVEELTLYIIEQQKAIETQNSEIDKMKEFIGLKSN
ncbi:MAG: hypothetical protein QM503_06660 [Bacteroidota bacterium]